MSSYIANRGRKNPNSVINRIKRIPGEMVKGFQQGVQMVDSRLPAYGRDKAAYNRLQSPAVQAEAMRQKIKKQKLKQKLGM